jgi:hypothetical protein
MGGERRHSARNGGEDERITFTFDLGDEALELSVSGAELPTVSDEERELSLALIRATVDSYDYDAGAVRLTKRLDYSAE